MKLKVASPFSNHMVLQRNKPIAIFGEGESGSRIDATLFFNENGVQKQVSNHCVVKNQKWLLYLSELPATDNCSLHITDGSERLEFSDIAVGEVWFCGGQSNMEFELQNCTVGAECLAKDHPNVRFYNVPRLAYIDEKYYEAQENNHWQTFDSESAKTWSAVGYLYGKSLSEKLGVTVGLIGCNWGGTSASAWMSRKQLSKDQDAATYLEDYEKATSGEEETVLIKRYEEYLIFEKEWNKKCDELYATVPGISWDEVQERIGVCKWPGPMCAHHPFRPSGLYETMVKTVAPYTMQGFIYYQGESDDHKPDIYGKMMELLIEEWRRDWNDDTMPFLYVQLPGHRYVQDEDRKHWCIIRSEQEKVSKTVPHTGMAVLIDSGEFNDIHPKNKVPVADRLYRQALYRVYHCMSEAESCAPCYESCEFYPEYIAVSFSHLDDDLVLRAPEVTGFEVAGEDMIYQPASAKICGRRVIVDTSHITKPAALRYLWTNYPEYPVSLYSRYGLPVAPFSAKEK